MACDTLIIDRAPPISTRGDGKPRPWRNRGEDRGFNVGALPQTGFDPSFSDGIPSRDLTGKGGRGKTEGGRRNKRSQAHLSLQMRPNLRAKNRDCYLALCSGCIARSSANTVEHKAKHEHRATY